jgi:hypothetical protein
MDDDQEGTGKKRSNALFLSTIHIKRPPPDAADKIHAEFATGRVFPDSVTTERSIVQ